MATPKISCIIPTVRDISLNEKCLKRQTIRDFEVIVVRPQGEKPKGLFYTLNRDYNRGIRQAKGELIISYQDMIEIQPDCLERFWEHYKINARGVFGAVGDQYSTLVPPVKVWTDPRRRTDQGTFYPCYPNDIEFTLCAIPKQALYDVGGFDEEYDKGAACSEKELIYRIDKAGYMTHLDQSIEYRAIKHPRLTDDWDKYYMIASNMYVHHLKEIEEGKRLRVDFL